MTYTRPTIGTIIRINWQFLWAYFWGWLAYASWRVDPELWGIAAQFDWPVIWIFYILSAFFGLICWGLLRGNLDRIAAHHRHDREVRKFNKRGTAPRSDRMANRNDLKNGGLLR